MSLGLPMHLVPNQLSRAFARAVHVVAFVCLTAALLYLLAIQSRLPGASIWPAAIAAGILLVLAWLLDRRRTTVYAVGYLIVGAACVYWIAITVLTQFAEDISTDSFVLSMAKVSLVMVGGSGVGPLAAACWSIAGLLVAEGATALAAFNTATPYVLDGTTLVALLILLVALTGLAFSRRRLRAAQPSLSDAARDEQLSAVRYRIEAKAAAVMHDTVLNDLASIASARTGAIGTGLREQVDRDLEQLLGEEWLIETESLADQESSRSWRHGKLFKVVDEMRLAGLEIEVTGDVTSLNRIGGERATALSQATKQCLVNVLKHSGTDHAELIVYGSDHEVSVMVIDTGKGFSEAETRIDRLGLRQSVRRRIENVGGSVQVWSTLGRGTSVMIRVPALELGASEPGSTDSGSNESGVTFP
jgi:signal transduction histidine kinase